MRILVLGGSVFVGKAIVRAALDRGHDVTTLSRGVSGEVPPGTTELRGDRSRGDGLQALASLEFDAVIDTSRQALSHVRRAVELLAPKAGAYLFVSTVSVYSELSETGTDEAAPTAAPLHDATAQQEDDPSCYPGLNIACEQAVAAGFPGSHVLLRPCLVVGHGDPTDRFGYWPARAARGGPAVAPGKPDRLVQFVDVADLAAFAVHAVEQSLRGTFNVRGPGEPTTMAQLVQECAAAAGQAPEWNWIDDDFLLARDLRPYVDLPLWLPDEPDYRGFDRIDGSRALNAGMTHRSLADTVLDAFSWEKHLGVDRVRQAGLEPDREKALLAEWAARV